MLCTNVESIEYTVTLLYCLMTKLIQIAVVVMIQQYEPWLITNDIKLKEERKWMHWLKWISTVVSDEFIKSLRILKESHLL